MIQNSSIAYALRVTTFGPFFAWGATGDFWPAIVTSAALGLGICLIYVLRRLMLEFLDDALRRDLSITIHEFIARQHGNDPRVRLLASGLTVFALSGLVIGEAFGVATLLKPVLLDHVAGTYLFIFGMLTLMVLYTIPSGNSGVMRSAQSQLGLLYPTLFGSTALLLYMLISSVRPMPPHGTFAVEFLVAFCAVMICYRRSRYVDASPITRTNYGNTDGTDLGREPPGVRVFRWYEKKLNGWITALAAAVIGLSLMELISEGLPAIAHNGAAALQTGTRMSNTALAALFLLPLFYPIVDMTNWQRIAALEKDGESSDLGPCQRLAALRRVLRIYATESPLVWLFMCMFGAIAVLATATPVGGDVMQAFMGFWPELMSRSAQAAKEAIATRRTIMAAGALYLVIIIVFYVADRYRQIGFASSTFLALLFALYCAQLSFVPLILGPVIGRTSGGRGTVSPRWALVILGSSSAIGLGTVIVYIMTGNESSLWAAVPACLGSGLLLFTVARLLSGARPGAA